MKIARSGHTCFLVKNSRIHVVEVIFDRSDVNLVCKVEKTRFSSLVIV